MQNDLPSRIRLQLQVKQAKLLEELEALSERQANLDSRLRTSRLRNPPDPV